MLTDEIRVACQGRESVVLVLPPPHGSGHTRRLSGRYGPRGVIVNDSRQGGQAVCFKAEDVLKFLDKIKAAEIGKEQP